MSVYACSDLHGRYDLWEKIQAYLKPSDKLYFLGDAIDRGPDGWKLMKELLLDGRVTYIEGNHEDMMLYSVLSNFCDMSEWFYNGGGATYRSLESDPEAKDWIYTLKHNMRLYAVYQNTNGKFIYLLHAGSNYPLPVEDKERMLWDRAHIDNPWNEEYNDIYIVHGHTPVPSGFYNDKAGCNESQTVCTYADGHKICIDGRSAYTGKIALLNLDTFEQIIFAE